MLKNYVKTKKKLLAKREEDLADIRLILRKRRDHFGAIVIMII